MRVTILSVNDSIVEWEDADGDVCKYPRMMFPPHVSTGQVYDYCGGEFDKTSAYNEVHNSTGKSIPNTPDDKSKQYKFRNKGR